MATRIVYFSQDPTDPMMGPETFREADRWCKEHGVTFSTLAVIALRSVLEMDPLDLMAVQQARRQLQTTLADKLTVRQESFAKATDIRALTRLARRVGARVEMPPEKPS